MAATMLVLQALAAAMVMASWVFLVGGEAAVEAYNLPPRPFRHPQPAYNYEHGGPYNHDFGWHNYPPRSNTHNRWHHMPSPFSHYNRPPLGHASTPAILSPSAKTPPPPYSNNVQSPPSASTAPAPTSAAVPPSPPSSSIPPLAARPALSPSVASHASPPATSKAPHFSTGASNPSSASPVASPSTSAAPHRAPYQTLAPAPSRSYTKGQSSMPTPSPSEGAPIKSVVSTSPSPTPIAPPPPTSSLGPSAGPPNPSSQAPATPPQAQENVPSPSHYQTPAPSPSSSYAQGSSVRTGPTSAAPLESPVSSPTSIPPPTPNPVSSPFTLPPILPPPASSVPPPQDNVSHHAKYQGPAPTPSTSYTEGSSIPPSARPPVESLLPSPPSYTTAPSVAPSAPLNTPFASGGDITLLSPAMPPQHSTHAQYQTPAPTPSTFIEGASTPRHNAPPMESLVPSPSYDNPTPSVPVPISLAPSSEGPYSNPPPSAPPVQSPLSSPSYINLAPNVLSPTSSLSPSASGGVVVAHSPTYPAPPQPHQVQYQTPAPTPSTFYTEGSSIPSPSATPVESPVSPPSYIQAPTMPLHSSSLAPSTIEGNVTALPPNYLAPATPPQENTAHHAQYQTPVPNPSTSYTGGASSVLLSPNAAPIESPVSSPSIILAPSVPPPTSYPALSVGGGSVTPLSPGYSAPIPPHQQNAPTPRSLPNLQPPSSIPSQASSSTRYNHRKIKPNYARPPCPPHPPKRG